MSSQDPAAPAAAAAECMSHQLPVAAAVLTSGLTSAVAANGHDPYGLTPATLEYMDCIDCKWADAPAEGSALADGARVDEDEGVEEVAAEVASEEVDGK